MSWLALVFVTARIHDLSPGVNCLSAGDLASHILAPGSWLMASRILAPGALASHILAPGSLLVTS